MKFNKNKTRPPEGTGANPWPPLKNDPKSVRNQAILKKFRGTSPSGLEKEVRSLDIRAIYVFIKKYFISKTECPNIIRVYNCRRRFFGMSHQNEVSLIELFNVISSGNNDLVHSYLKIHDFEYNYEFDKEQIKVSELNSYKNLLKHMVTELSPSQTSGFYLGFKLKDQANTQFDLLKVANETVVNIEFKSDEPDKGILSQASEHHRILSMAFNRIIVLEHLATTDELFCYDSSNKKMVLVPYNRLKDIIPNDSTGLNKLIKMTRSDFLVAPYNEPQKFLRSSYQLTTNQNNIKSAILKSGKGMSMIKGGPGSGKTLLLVDIVRELQSKGFSIGMVMGAKPSSGQKLLMETMGVSLYWYYTLSSLEPLLDKDVLVFDETQRITQNIIDEVKKLTSDKIVVFSIDQQQVVHPEEKDREVQKQLEDIIDDKQIYELKQSVRINPELNSFYHRLLNKKYRGAPVSTFDNAAVRYFNDENDAKTYIQSKRDSGSVVIESDEYITQSTNRKTRKKEVEVSKNTKDVIGQEFRDVLLVFDQYVDYGEDDKLFVKNHGYYPYYDEKMIFQAITRASNSLEIVILNNLELYIALQGLLTRSRDSHKKNLDKKNELKEQVKSLKLRVDELEHQLAEYKS